MRSNHILSEGCACARLDSTLGGGVVSGRFPRCASRKEWAKITIKRKNGGGSRTLLGAKGIATRSDRTLLGAPGLTTRSKDATRGRTSFM